MLKTTNLFLPTAISPKSDSFAFLFAGLSFPIPKSFLQQPFPQQSFWAGYDKFGLFVSNECPSWSLLDHFFCEKTSFMFIAKFGVVPQACLDTFFGVDHHPSSRVMRYQLSQNFAFHSEDIDAMIDAIAPQASLAKDN